MLKLFCLALATIGVSAQIVDLETTANITNCLSCKLKDSKSSFTESYSYCTKDHTCLKDEWNFVNAWCPSKWVPGWQLNIDKDCGAVDYPMNCLPIFASQNQVAIQVDYTLPPAGQCTITIDATQSMARVKFNKAANLGVLFTGYKDGEPITLPKGEVQQITVYNGDTKLSLAFEITVSSAKFMAASLASLALGSALVYM